MKPVAASPVLHHARALGRAFRGAGRALRLWRTWFVLFAFGTVIPFAVVVPVGALFGGEIRLQPGEVDVSPAAAAILGLLGAFWMLQLCIVLPLLEGDRTITFRCVRAGGWRLATPTVAVVGLMLAEGVLVGWEIDAWIALGQGRIFPLADLAVMVAMAGVFALLLATIRPEAGWRWSAFPLLVAGVLLFAGDAAVDALNRRLWELEFDPEANGAGPFLVPAIAWITWRLGDALVGLVALEYLRIEPPHAPAPAEPTP